MATIRGGEKLEAAMADLARKVSRPGTLRVGIVEGATYPDGTPVALIAALNEYGVPSHGQPPRPAIRRMIRDKSPEWPAAIADLLKDNDMDAVAALNLAGAAIAGQWRQAILDFWDPPNAPSTIAKKGFDAPLRETMHMLRSVDHQVKTS